jgi:hypothetical protein
MKILSFSLYGNLPIYNIGAIRNAESYNKFYPGWKCRFYVNDEIPKDIIEKLKEHNCEIINMSDSNIPGMYWRFLPMDDKSVETFVVRDVDSRLSDREKNAVDEWLNSGKSLHIMRDHPHHNFYVLGGMWGFKKNKDYSISDKILEFVKERNFVFTKGDDQIFLINLFNEFQNDHFSHDSFFTHFPNTKKFPTERIGKRFVGEIFDENDNPHYQYTLIP